MNPAIRGTRRLTRHNPPTPPKTTEERLDEYRRKRAPSPVAPDRKAPVWSPAEMREGLEMLQRLTRAEDKLERAKGHMPRSPATQATRERLLRERFAPVDTLGEKPPRSTDREFYPGIFNITLHASLHDAVDGLRSDDDAGDELLEALENFAGGIPTKIEAPRRRERIRADGYAIPVRLRTTMARAVAGLRSTNDASDELLEELEGRKTTATQPVRKPSPETIRAAIARTGSMVKAAKLLGFPRTTLRLILKK